MKVQMVLMDAGALEIVLRCGDCHKSVMHVVPADWNDDVPEACPSCGVRWTSGRDEALLRRATAAIRDLVREASDTPFEVLFGASRIGRPEPSA